MNLFSSKLTLLAALTGTLIIGCSKTPVEVPQRPGQQPGDQQPSGIVLNFETPAQTPILADSATLWLDKNGIAQQARVKIQSRDGKTGTGRIELPAGNYQVNYVLLTNDKGQVVYVSPRSQSEKASQVARPLPLAVAASANSTAAAMEMLPVAAGEQAQLFGYPQNLFSQQQMIRVELHMGIHVGNVLYRYFDAPLEITWYNVQGQAQVQLVQLSAQTYGVHSIGLPAGGSRYELRLRKWDKTFEKVIQANELHQDMTIELIGDMAARRLTEEYTWHETQGEYRPYSRKTYEYDAAGRVIRARYYQKSPQKPDLQLQTIEEFTYLAGDRLGTIYYFDANHVSTGSTIFMYDGNNRISHMEQRNQAGTTYASVEYRSVGTKEEVTIDYLFDNGQAMEYKFVMQNGNKISEGAISSTGGTEGSRFSYDQHINPFRVMGVQDIFLRHLSLNNKTGEDRTYSGNIPNIVAYNFNYSYDSKGYPTQLITSYKGYSSGEHLYRAKTQYTYNN